MSNTISGKASNEQQITDVTNEIVKD